MIIFLRFRLAASAKCGLLIAMMVVEGFAFAAPAQTSAGTPLMMPASVQPFFVTDIYAKESGYISRINNDIGDRVKKEQILALIENPELQAQLDKADAAVQQAKAALELQELTLMRQKELYAGKAITQQTLDEAQARESMAKADWHAATAETARLQAILSYDKIVAPYDCTVTRRLANPGDLVQASTSTRTAPLFTCQANDTVRVLADAPEAYAGLIHPGLPAEVKLYDSSATSRQGKITRIASALDPATRTMRIEIDLPNADGALLPGKYAQVTLNIASHPSPQAKP
jgi:membrane fusion protein, multidrug efflux system